MDEMGRDKFIAIAAWSDGGSAPTDPESGFENRVEEFANVNGLTFPNLDLSLGGRFERNGGIPTFVLMGPGHKLLMVDEGKPSTEQIQAAIDGTW